MSWEWLVFSVLFGLFSLTWWRIHELQQEIYALDSLMRDDRERMSNIEKGVIDANAALRRMTEIIKEAT